MANRQAGAQIENLYRDARTDEERSVVIAAFKVPRYLTQAFQSQAIDKFVTTLFIACAEQK